MLFLDIPEKQKQIRKKFTNIFKTHYPQLIEVLDGYWNDLRNRMFSCNMIGKETSRSKCSQELLDEFQSGFSTRDEFALYNHCKQFVNILKDLGGQPQNAAVKLEKAWGSVDEAFFTFESHEQLAGLFN